MNILENDLVRKIETIYKILIASHKCSWGHGIQHILCDYTCHCICKPPQFQPKRECEHGGLKRYCGKDVYCEECKKNINSVLDNCRLPIPHLGKCEMKPQPKTDDGHCRRHQPGPLDVPNLEQCTCKPQPEAGKCAEIPHHGECCKRNNFSVRNDKVEEKIKNIVGKAHRLCINEDYETCEFTKELRELVALARGK